MMNLYCQAPYLVTVDFEHSIVNMYKDNFIKFKEPFLVLRASNCLSVFEGKIYIPRRSESWPDCDFTLINGNSLPVSCDNIENVYISAYEIVKFPIEDFKKFNIIYG